MNSIIKFHSEPFINALKAFFEELKVPADYLADEPASPKDILGEKYKATNEAHKLMDDVYALGMVNDGIFEGKETFRDLAQVKKLKVDYDGLLLFGVTLTRRADNLPIARSHLAEITRVFNRAFPYTPVTIVFKYGDFISLANSERIKYKQEWREGEKTGKVTILRDIHTQAAHAGHKRILNELRKPVEAASYKELHQHWLKVLDVNILNKKFFQDLANWYFWAMEHVSFPDDLEKKKEVRNATGLIRLITRIIFIWFIKEKSLVPDVLFNEAYLDGILKDFNKNKKSKNYYLAILQNLFFGTLNQKMDERKFVREGNININKAEFGVKNLFRYADLFRIAEKEVVRLFKDVPFLNGGLFDCLDKPDEEGKSVLYADGFSRNPKKQAHVPDYIFFGEEREIDLNDTYATKNKTYKSKGLIKLLESYKFTVAENTPDEEEVALDPELLGRVFENLLASYNPETQTTARKQTGSFYTPREIVNYMADESLLEYLKQNAKNKSKDFETRLRKLISYSETENPFNETETKALIEGISNCKILDPACGSGAYPMGILHKMVHLLQKLDPENTHWKALQLKKAEGGKLSAKEVKDVFKNNPGDYGRKLYLIENCIYGIDIQPIAVQISKLRFFISLIIDQNKQPSKEKKGENFGIRSLPNLETKFVAANTLIALDKPAQTFLRNLKIEAKETERKELRHKYFTANTRKQKQQCQKQDKKLRQEIAKMLESDGWQTATAKQIAAFDPYDQNSSSPWFDPEWMFGLTTGFDIVIGNPPYVQLQKNDGSLSKQYEKVGYQTFERTGDIYSLFYERAWQILKPKGTLCFITSNKWMRAGYGESTRKFFAEKTNPILLIDFAGQKIFDAATVDTNILMFAKDKNEQRTKACLVKACIMKENPLNNLSAFVRQFAASCSFSTDKSWVILSPIEQSIKAKIEAVGTPLHKWDISIYIGIITGFNEAFIIDGKKRKELIEQDPKSSDIIRPILRGRDIKRYRYKFADKWLICAHNGIKERGIKPINIDDYPAVKKHLDRFYLELAKRDRANQGETPYNLRNCAYMEDFSKPKIMYPNMTKFLPFVYDDKAFLTNQKCFIVTGENVEFLSAFLNSSLFKYCFRDNFPELQGGTRELSTIFFDKIPVIQVSKEINLEFRKMVLKLQDLIARELVTKALELEIDEMIFDLYSLTPEEKKTIGFIEIQ